MHQRHDSSPASFRRRILTILMGVAALNLRAPGAASAAEAPSVRDPAQPVRMCAEWEPAFGTLIRWPLGIPSDLAIELARDDSLYVLVETSGQESQARTTFATWGIDLSVVRFVYADTYSHWTRDWGPHSVFDGDGVYGITDPIFNGYPWVPGCLMDCSDPGMATPDDRSLPDWRPRRSGPRGWEEDDAVNAALAIELGCPRHALPAYCTGGNIMTDGHGIAFSTRRMVNENHGLCSEEEFRQLAYDYLGIGIYHLLDDPEVYGIQHVDCYAKLLDEETILIKELPTGHPEYDCVERLVDQVAATANCHGRPYRVVRIYCGIYQGDAAAAYTNSLILNRKVLVPLFNIACDSAALATYAEAMPGYEVIGFPWGAWYDYDALHCRTMAIFDRHMLRIAHRPFEAEVLPMPDYEIVAMIDDRSELGLIAEELALFWRPSDDPDWNRETLTATADSDSFAAMIPGAPPGTTIEYYLSAADSSGRHETLPRTAPAGCYRFAITADPADARSEPRSIDTRLTIRPNPFLCGTTIAWDRAAGICREVQILDCRGRRVRTLRPEPGGLSVGALVWDGRDEHGVRCPAGLYWIRAARATGPACGKLLRLR